MRFSFVFVAAIASFASAAVIGERELSYPPCAWSCLSNASLQGCPTFQDVVCLCNKPAFVSATTACIQNACTVPAELQQAQEMSISVCQSAGVNLRR